MENEERAGEGKGKREEKRTQKGSESYLGVRRAFERDTMVLLQASRGVDSSAHIRCWTYLLELRSRSGLAAPVMRSQ
jgi:hypothetical protein